MIGNDVVDLADRSVAERPRHPRFDERVFAPAERAALARSGAPERLRWMLWAAKEAAYKVAKKLDAEAVWSPRHFVVELGENLAGCVRHRDREIPVRVELGAGFVHALATDGTWEAGERRANVAASDEDDASAAVRALARRDLAVWLGANEEELAIERRGRIPALLRGGVATALDLSLSHHGRFVAWAGERT